MTINQHCNGNRHGNGQGPRAARRAIVAMVALATTLGPVAATAQGYPPPPPTSYPPPPGAYPPPPPGSYPPPPGAYPPSTPNGYPDSPSAYPPPEPAPPQGYSAGQVPPPPPGYVPPPDAAAARDADARYAADAQAWARDNCVKAHGNVGAGAVIGGVLGAIIGGSLAGRHDGGGAVVAGAALGAVGGAAVASASGSNETSPGCPPGFVVRARAPAYAYTAPTYVYAAPGWYQPWVFIGGAWIYRPYPYHDWYWHTYRGPGWRGGWHGDWRGPAGYRGYGGGWNRGGWHGGGWHGGGWRRP